MPDPRSGFGESHEPSAKAYLSDEFIQCQMGLDDNWQHCGSYGSDNFTYHDEAGFPVVNPARFPDMLAMTNHAHKLGLTAGWYLNNCICSDHCGSRQWSPRVSDSDTKCYDGDSAALIEFGFDVTARWKRLASLRVGHPQVILSHPLF